MKQKTDTDCAASTVEPLSIRKNFLWNTGGCLTYQACQWLITILVVTLSTDYTNSGVLSIAMSVGNVFSTIATYNVRTYQISDIRNRFSSKNYVAFRFMTIALAFVLVYFYLLATTNSTSMIVTVCCYLVFKADESFCNVFYGIDQKGSRMDYIGISQAVRGLLTLGVFAIVLSFTQSLNVAIIVMALSCMLVTATYDRLHSRKLSDVKPRITISCAKDLFRICLPAVLTLACFGSVVMVARQIFQMQNGSDALGIYAAVATPTVIVQVAASYLYAPFLSTIANEWVHDDYIHLRTTLLKVACLIVLVFVAIFVLGAFFGDWLLLLLFGDSISGFTYLLLPALLATAAVAVMGFMLDILIVFRKMNGALISNVLALACDVAVIFWAINKFGMNGINLTIIVAFFVGIFCASFFLSSALKACKKRATMGKA